jgi:hypothetical protein
MLASLFAYRVAHRLNVVPSMRPALTSRPWSI